MALIDSQANEIVIRVVYDGPPEAGKTTSLRALAGSLAQPTFTPEEAPDGRTLWFDWMEYVGGRFEGCQIRCQVITVPGQRALAARRRRLLENADAVVFVGDSSARDGAQMISYLLELREMLADTRPSVGVILQANKRDLPDAIPLDELRRRLGEAGSPVGIIESVAADGTGIRETFVYAVRLALDRVRELMNQHALSSAPARPATADDLLDALRADDVRHRPRVVVAAGPGSVAADLLREVLSSEDDAAHAPALAGTPAAGAPRPPDTSVPSGAIWPPVEGRAILCELSQLALAPRRLGSGDWAAGLGSGWRMVSRSEAVFDSLDLGRSVLIQWARMHAGAAGTISPRRCVVLADNGDRRWRMWQIVRAERSLRDAVDAALRDHAGDSVIPPLCRVAQTLLDADDRLSRTSLGLAIALDCIGMIDGLAVYTGLMPEASAVLTGPRPRTDPRALLKAQLEPFVLPALRERALDFDHVLARIPGIVQPPEGIGPTLSALLRA